MPNWGLNQGYCQFAIGISRHDALGPPPPPGIKSLLGLFEGPAFMGAHPGRPLTHKVGQKTFFDGNRAVQQGHDVGYVIPHVAALFNSLMAVYMLTSKHKVMFPVSKVVIEGKPMGTFLFMFGGLICSNPTSLPTGICVPFAGTVQTEITLKDVLLGLAFIAVDIMMDVIFKKVIQGNKGKVITDAVYRFTIGRIIKGRIENISNTFLRTALGKLKDHFGKSWVMSPLLSGSIFQGLQLTGALGVPRTEVPGIAIGRAGAHVAFFPWGGVSGNVFN